MFRHNLPQLSPQTAFINYERRYEWERSYSVEVWSNHVLRQYTAMCVELGLQNSALRWNDNFQYLLEQQGPNPADLQKYMQDVFDSAVAFLPYIVDNVSIRYTSTNVADNKFGQLSMQPQNCSFQNDGLFYSVWPQHGMAKQFAEEYAKAAKTCNTPMVCVVQWKGLVIVVMSICPLIQYNDIPLVQNELLHEFHMPLTTQCRMGADGRWYVFPTPQTSLLAAGNASVLLSATQSSRPNTSSSTSSGRPIATPNSGSGREKKTVPMSQIHTVLQRPSVDVDIRRRIALEIVTRCCKKVLFTEIMMSKNAFLQPTMHANRMLAIIGSVETLRQILFPFVLRVYPHNPALPEALKLIETPESCAVMLQKMHDICRIRSARGQVTTFEPWLKSPYPNSKTIVPLAQTLPGCLKRVLSLPGNYQSSEHVADIVTCIMAGLFSVEWATVQRQWKRFVATNPPQTLRKVIFHRLSLTLDERLHSCGTDTLHWYATLCKTFFGIHSPQYIRTCDCHAQHNEQSKKIIFAMMSRESLITDLISQPKESFWNPEGVTRDTVTKWLQCVQHVCNENRLPSGLVAFRVRTMTRQTSVIIKKWIEHFQSSKPVGDNVFTWFCYVLTLGAEVCIDVNFEAVRPLLDVATKSCNSIQNGSEREKCFVLIQDIAEKRKEREILLKIIRIQRCFRCWGMRKYKAWVELREASVRVIQKMSRGAPTRSNLRKVHRIRVQKSYVLEKIGRSYLSNVHFQHLRISLLRQTALQIQRFGRAHEQRRVLHISREAVLALQRIGRGTIEHTRLRKEHLRYRSAKLIQRCSRALQIRQSLGSLWHHWKHVASLGRGYRARRVMGGLVVLKKTQQLQRIGRALQVRREENTWKVYGSRLPDIFTLQRIGRGKLLRNQWFEAISLIHRVSKGYVVRQKASEKWTFKLCLANRQQQFEARRMQQALNRKKLEELCVQLFQRAGRGYMTRSEFCMQYNVWFREKFASPTGAILGDLKFGRAPRRVNLTYKVDHPPVDWSKDFFRQEVALKARLHNS